MNDAIKTWPGCGTELVDAHKGNRMTDVVERMRDGTTVPLMEERIAIADEIERNRAELRAYEQECANLEAELKDYQDCLAEAERNQAAIAELIGILIYYRDDYTGNEPSRSVLDRKVDAAISKHTTKIKEQ